MDEHLAGGAGGVAVRSDSGSSEAPVSMKACPTCGNLVPEGDWFCRECGTVVAPHGDLSVGDVTASSASRHYVPEPGSSVIPKVLGGLAAVLVAAGVVWWVRGGRLPFALPWEVPVEAGSVAAGSSDGHAGGGATGGPGAEGGAAGQGSAAADGTADAQANLPATQEPEQSQDATGQDDLAGTAVTYELVQEALSWSEAEAWCEEHGGTLAQPHSIEELARIGALVKPTELWVVWVGAQPSSEAGSGYAWFDGTPVAGELYDAGEPNNETGSEDCLAIFRTNEGYYLYDVDCDLRGVYPANRLGFVMERSA